MSKKFNKEIETFMKERNQEHEEKGKKVAGEITKLERRVDQFVRDLEDQMGKFDDLINKKQKSVEKDFH